MTEPSRGPHLGGILFLGILGFLLGLSTLRAESDDDLTRSLEAIRELRKAREFEAAEAQARALLTEVEREHGAESLPAAEALDELVAVLQMSGNFREEPLDLALRAVLLRAQIEGSESRTLEPGLSRLAFALHWSGDLEAARDTYRWLLRIRTAVYGNNDPRTLRALLRLGNVQVDLGDNEGVGSMRTAVAGLERRFGAQDVRVAPALFALANVLFGQGKYVESISYWRRTLKIFSREPSRDLHQIARSHSNLGEAFHRLGDITASRTHLEAAIRFGLPDGPATAKPWPQGSSTFVALAALLHDTGELDAAARYYEQALGLSACTREDCDPSSSFSQWSGRDPYGYAEGLSHYAILLEETGRWEEALTRQRESLALRREKLGDADFRTARSHGLLGAMLLRFGHLEEAARELHSALAVQEEVLEPHHDHLAQTLLSMAQLAERRGQQALGYLQRSLRILEAIGPEHPDLIKALVLWARWNARTEPDGAQQAVERALAIARNSFGSGSPYEPALLTERARLQALNGDSASALRSALQADTISRDLVRISILAFGEVQALRFSASRRQALDLAIHLLVTAPDELAAGALDELGEQTWGNVMRSRAMILDSLVARRRLLESTSDATLQQLKTKLIAARSRLSAIRLRRLGELPTETRRELLSQFEEAVHRAEENLARASKRLLREKAVTDISLQEVRDQLPDNAALVAFSRYAAEPADPADPERYVAFVTLGREQPIKAVPLGSALRLDTLIASWREHVARPDLTPASEVADIRRVGSVLRAQLWDPIATTLGSARLVFLVPDGSLSLINPAALPIGREAYLIDHGFRFHFLTSEREIARFARLRSRKGALLALGHPDFDLVPSQLAQSAPARPVSHAEQEFRPSRAWASCRNFRSRTFYSLPNTEQEIESITNIWRRHQLSTTSESLLGIAASEQNFRHYAPRSRFIHLATHGFFLAAECFEESAPKTASERWPKRSQLADSLGVSGLVLAGANRRSEQNENEDGLLTATEIASLDLSQADWVVLSACDTGVGDVFAGEGTFGLRRAFSLAGARTLIMSLWQVGDREARRFMTALYQARFAENLDTVNAIHHATASRLKELREAGGSTHPGLWAPFVATGGWN